MKAAPCNRLRVPVVLPLVEITIEVDGTATVDVDGNRYDAEAPIERKALAEVLKYVAAQRGPVRVHVTESDGSEFTDVIVPGGDGGHPQSSDPHLSGIASAGFLPDEDVEVAVVVARQRADSDGTARVRVPPALLAGRACTVVLVGCSSRAVAVCERA